MAYLHRVYFALTALVVVCCSGSSAHALDRLVHLNRQLQGKVIGYTDEHHSQDNRLPSAILGQCRDLYVYVPPGYDPTKSYSLMLWLHGAFGDERSFLLGASIKIIDDMICSGKCAPFLIACPDGLYQGNRRFFGDHSFYVNGRGGRFEDHLMEEIVPFLMSRYSIQTDRSAHVIFGQSAGGFGALQLAIKRRDFFSTVATMAAPVNLRITNERGRYFQNFDPATYRWREEYLPREIVARFFGVLGLRARLFMNPVFGPRENVISEVMRSNPADLIFSENLQPGELAIYLHYPGHDNFNFDAQNESFAWLAEQRGIDVELVSDPKAHHSGRYFNRNIVDVYNWLCPRLPWPIPAETECCPAPTMSYDEHIDRYLESKGIIREQVPEAVQIVQPRESKQAR